jgi:hypothetical protein
MDSSSSSCSLEDPQPLVSLVVLSINEVLLFSRTQICYCSLKIRLNLSLVQLLLSIYSSEGRRKRETSNFSREHAVACSRRVWREAASKELLPLLLLVRRVEGLQGTRQRNVGGTEAGF